MNNQVFYYPLYPHYEDEYMMDEERGNELLFSPSETLMYGNIFKNEYKPYKNYIPSKVEMKNRDVLNLMEIIDQMHDLRLHLDIYPNDKKVIDLYCSYYNKYKELKAKVENSDDNPFPTSCTKDERTNYVYTPSPWVK